VTLRARQPSVNILQWPSTACLLSVSCHLSPLSTTGSERCLHVTYQPTANVHGMTNMVSHFLHKVNKPPCSEGPVNLVHY